MLINHITDVGLFCYKIDGSMLRTKKSAFFLCTFSYYYSGILAPLPKKNNFSSFLFYRFL